MLGAHFRDICQSRGKAIFINLLRAEALAKGVQYKA